MQLSICVGCISWPYWIRNKSIIPLCSLPILALYYQFRRLTIERIIFVGIIPLQPPYYHPPIAYINDFPKLGF
jgi:hypothetical protein